MSILVAILAADRSEGFPSSKYLADVRGTKLVDLVVADAMSWPVDEVVVVLGADGAELERESSLSDVSVVVDPSWEEGSASPIRAVLDMASRDRSVTHCILARGDQPGVDPGIVAALVERARATEADVTLPKYRYTRGWPVVLARSVWDVFLGQEGSIDVHDVVATHARAVEEVHVDHLAPRIIERFEDLPASRR
ncbi:MAG TPA: NTP transferase domain-containing protein [Acidimicrobiia bacterium]|nr:NTP transferase domain-containing protein [Acidimicrobiia bacterium]